jgi:lipopolysaccharide transport system permease protein
MLVAGLPIGWQIVTLPLFVALAVAASFAVSVWLAALNALYRDVRHAVPFLTQVWMFASPIVYTTASVMDGRPDWVRHLYAANPMAGVADGFRWALLGGTRPPLFEVAASVLIVVGVGHLGLHFFRRLERRLADLL